MHNAAWRARFPPITAEANGTLLALFTRQSSEHERAGLGELVLTRSADADDAGCHWSAPEVLYAPPSANMRALGTMTTLRSGRIVAPFAEITVHQIQCIVRMLSSKDGKEDWQVDTIDAAFPLVWRTPTGKMIESGGDLVMPVYGSASDQDLKRTIMAAVFFKRLTAATHGAIFLDCPQPRPVIGAVSVSWFAFEGPQVQLLPDGRWLAILSARRLNRAGNGPTSINEGSGCTAKALPTLERRRGPNVEPTRTS